MTRERLVALSVCHCFVSSAFQPIFQDWTDGVARIWQACYSNFAGFAAKLNELVQHEGLPLEGLRAESVATEPGQKLQARGAAAFG
jgi:hypothetical protein